MADYATWTCSNCGKREPANLMSKKRVASAASFKSRKSVTPLTFVGAVLGSRKSKGALESWVFTTSSRKGRGNATRQVKLCSGCSFLSPLNSGASSGGGFSFFLKAITFPIWVVPWFLYVALKITLKSSVFFVQFVRKNGIDKHLWTLLTTVILSLFGFAKFGTQTTFGFFKQYRYKKSLSKKEDVELISQFVKNSNFVGLVNYFCLKRVAMADGVITRDESLYLRDVSNLSVKDSVLVDYLIENEHYSKSIATMIPDHPSLNATVKNEIIEKLFFVSELDGEVGESELDEISSIKNLLGVDDRTFNRLRREAHDRVLKSQGTFHDPEFDKKIEKSLQ